MKTIWFDRGHSVRNALALIRAGADGRVRLIASHPYGDAAALAAADLALIEPLDAHGYRDWCLDMCRVHEVDLFVPGMRRDLIAGDAAAFAAAGTRVALPAAADVLDLLDDKWAFMDVAAAAGLPVPQAWLARGGNDVRGAVAALREQGLDACVKPRRGVFGAGFWRLVDERPLIATLMDVDARMIAVEAFAQALDGEGAPDLLVLEFLPGHETSVDVLAQEGRIVTAVARRKERVGQWVESEGEAIDLAAATVKLFGLSGLINVQMIEDAGGQPRLIEVNTRMSGGCLNTVFAGVNLPWWHVALELGLASAEMVPQPRGRALVAAVPDAIRLDAPAPPFSTMIRDE
ncbi:ATP-grasp domain-containing protein [uncultured Sphingomonas sp.]|uniref:ATP-grasp domain-containing protein n=1 Tax=uncultured Sphingomonas sp. TaxID=158754 RepID=UPI0026099C2B|nr:ATP-grasp domain-containing protein [uncultured Sphingomonas sp.]